MHRNKRLLAPLIVLACSAALAACGGSDGQVRVAAAAERFPSENLSDWKSYADHVAIFTVRSESEVPPPTEEADRGEGLVGRRVTLDIEKIIWSAPDAPELPRDLTTSAPGWVLHDGERIPLVIEGAPRVAVGDRYLAPLVRVEEGPTPEWGPLTLGAVMPLGENRVSEPQSRAENPLRDTLAGHSVAEVAESLEQTQPDPRADKLRELRPTERVKAVMAEQDAERRQQGP